MNRQQRRAVAAEQHRNAKSFPDVLTQLPRECDLVNVANMRHLWILPVPLRIGWFGE